MVSVRLIDQHGAEIQAAFAVAPAVGDQLMRMLPGYMNYTAHVTAVEHREEAAGSGQFDTIVTYTWQAGAVAGYVLVPDVRRLDLTEGYRQLREADLVPTAPRMIAAPQWDHMVVGALNPHQGLSVPKGSEVEVIPEVILGPKPDLVIRWPDDYRLMPVPEPFE